MPKTIEHVDLEFDASQFLQATIGGGETMR